MSKQFILFGAGACGRQALKYYSADKVYCFVDNDRNKAGQRVCGKPVINFDELLLIAEHYSIVISSGHFEEMSAQLENNGITGYRHYHPVLEKTVPYVISKISEYQHYKLILYGVDAETDIFLKCLIESLEEKSDFRAIDIIEGSNVTKLKEITGQNVCAIIGNKKFHDAYYLQVKQLINEKSIIINPFRHLWGDADIIIVNR